jgi:hypothetical protein
MNKLSGKWAGHFEQILHDVNHSIPLEMELKTFNNNIISGQAKFEFQDNNYEMVLEGELHSRNLLKLNYENETLLQFGTFVLELSENPEQLSGDFIGYGPISNRIVKGSLILNKLEEINAISTDEFLSAQSPLLYYERKKEMVKSPYAEHEIGISTNDDDRIKVIIQRDGHYFIIAKGTYEGAAYCEVNALLFVYNVNTNQEICRGTIKSAYNTVGYPPDNYSIRTSKTKDSQEVSGVLKHYTGLLKKGDVLELRYGNEPLKSNNTIEQRRFYYASPGDFLALIRIPHLH